MTNVHLQTLTTKMKSVRGSSLIIITWLVPRLLVLSLLPLASQTVSTTRVTVPFARARISAARAAAASLSDSRLPPAGPVLSPHRDGHCWCSKCSKRGHAKMTQLSALPTRVPGIQSCGGHRQSHTQQRRHWKASQKDVLREAFASVVQSCQDAVSDIAAVLRGNEPVACASGSTSGPHFAETSFGSRLCMDGK